MILSKTFTINSDTTYGTPEILELPKVYDYVPGEILQVVIRVVGSGPFPTGDVIISYKEDDSTNIENFVYNYETANFPFIDTFAAPFGVRKDSDGNNRLYFFIKTASAVTVKVRIDYKVYLSKLTGL
jgi:hypothetical protein